MNQLPNKQLPETQQLLEALRQTKAKMERVRERLSEPLAIVGVGCRFPDASNPDEYWNMLSQGRRVELRTGNRWSESLTAEREKQAGRITANRGSFLDQIDQFDTGFFGISGREAAMLDPQQRLLLEVAWETFENAAIDPWQCRGGRVGAFVGICSNDYLHRLTDRPYETIDTYLSTGNSHGAAAGRLSYFMDWRGPAVAVDTACSSSLTALHLAARSLRYGDCDLAMVMGVNVILAPELSISLSQAGMLSPTGRCHTFSDAADGFARGEGCGGILLKRLSRAIEDKDRILCLVRGTASNQDGRSNGLTAPNGQSQQQVIRDALLDARCRAEDVDYIEAHGTGTPLGDPIEVDALRAIFAEDRRESHVSTSVDNSETNSATRPLRIGSAKANLGHLEGAAGIAGVIKVALSLANECLPPHPEHEKPSERIDWNWPVKVSSSPTPWNRNSRARIAGVSSFGFGGSNVHAVLSEAPGANISTAVSMPDHGESESQLVSLFVLSARSDEALREQAVRWSQHLKARQESLADVCLTACVGRTPFESRLAVITNSTEQLADCLSRFANENAQTNQPGSSSNSTATRIINSLASDRQDYGSSALSGGKTDSTRTAQLLSLAQRFVQGESIDWNIVQPRPFGENAIRISLPTYPFQRTRRWFDENADRPLLGQRLDLAGETIVYETDLSRLSYLQDHQVNGTAIYPASGFLELAISAGKAASDTLLAVDNLQIDRPIVVRIEEETKVQVQLSPTENGYSGKIAIRTATSWHTAASFELCQNDSNDLIPNFLTGPSKQFGDQLREVSAADHYQFASRLGLQYGPSFQGVRKLFVTREGDSEITGIVSLPEPTPVGSQIFHLALLDACFQVAATGLRDLTSTWLPVSVGKYVVHESPISNQPIRVSAKIDRSSDYDAIKICFAIYASEGKLLAVVENLGLKPFGSRQPQGSPQSAQAAVHGRENFTESDLPATSMRDFLHGRVADIMGLTVSEIPTDKPLDGLGLDSLMAFELRDELERKLHITIPIELFLEDITLDDFSRIVEEKLCTPVDAKDGHQFSGGSVQHLSQNGWTEGEI